MDESALTNTTRQLNGLDKALSKARISLVQTTKHLKSVRKAIEENLNQSLSALESRLSLLTARLDQYLSRFSMALLMTRDCLYGMVEAMQSFIFTLQTSSAQLAAAFSYLGTICYQVANSAQEALTLFASALDSATSLASQALNNFGLSIEQTAATAQTALQAFSEACYQAIEKLKVSEIGGKGSSGGGVMDWIMNAVDIYGLLGMTDWIKKGAMLAGWKGALAALAMSALISLSDWLFSNWPSIAEQFSGWFSGGIQNSSSSSYMGGTTAQEVSAYGDKLTGADQWMPNLFAMLQQGIHDAAPSLNSQLGNTFNPQISPHLQLSSVPPQIVITGNTIASDMDIDLIGDLLVKRMQQEGYLA